jgi:hypothetical protein
MQGERNTQFSRGTTLLDDLEFEWFLLRSSAFQDWRRKLRIALEAREDASPRDPGL